MSGLPWKNFIEELDRHIDTAGPLELWWRDDDAHRVCEPLLRLLELSERYSLPLCLATVPALIEAEFVPLIRRYGLVSVSQHGFSHRNYAPSGQGLGKWELGEHRELALVGDEMRQGQAILSGHFPQQHIPLCVPPWTRIHPVVSAQLPQWGFRGLSTFGPRQRHQDLIVLNSHVDVLKWKPAPHFRGTEKILGDLLEHLQLKRDGLADPAEPTGLLTHHLDTSQETWDFLDRFFETVGEISGIRWIAADSIIARETGHERN